MQATTAIVTDSTAYIAKDVRAKLGIHMIPLSVLFGSEAYQEEVDISAEAFYEKMAESDTLPTTSQPALGAFVELFTKLKDAGYKEVVTIHLSSKISGTYQNALQAGEMVDGIDVYGFDSGISCAPQAYFVEEAAKLAQRGEHAEEIIERLEAMRSNIRAYFVVNDLKHLYRGGRLSSGQFVVGQLLKMKPVLHFEDGEIVPFAKVRTEKRALQQIISMLEDDVVDGNEYRVSVIHAMREAKANEIATSISKRFPNVTVEIGYFGPVIGTHLGEGSLGISWYRL